MPPICPKCRGNNLRRRKRSGLRMLVLSLLGKWPYQCEKCGEDFFLLKRHVGSYGRSESKSARKP